MTTYSEYDLDNFCLEAIENLDWQRMKYLLTAPEFVVNGKPSVNIHWGKEAFFSYACHEGNLDMVRYLLTSPEILEAGHTYPNLHINNEYGFRIACEKGYLEVVKFLMTDSDLIKCGHTRPDIHILNDSGFFNACKMGHLNVVNFLFASPELENAGYTGIYMNDCTAFKYACIYGHLEMVHNFIFEKNMELNDEISEFLIDDTNEMILSRTLVFKMFENYRLEKILRETLLGKSVAQKKKKI